MKKLFMAVAAIAAVYLSLSFIEKPKETILGATAVPGEEYDPALFANLQSVNDLINYADSAVGFENRRNLIYAEFLAQTLRKRFYHGFSDYGPDNNWIAWLSGELIWRDLKAIVIPDHILKYPNAACSQQAIVLSACFEKIGVPYREINLVGHFVLEGKINNHWYYFDTNLEPRFINQRSSLNDLIKKKELFPSYENKRSRDDLEVMFSAPVYKSENAPIAEKARLFHNITKLLSLTILLLIPATAFVLYRQRRQNNYFLKN